jgi:tRNA-intron endonuclease
MSKIKQSQGELVENRIIIWDIEESRKLFKNRFYGKPLGIPKPKTPDFDAPLILDLIEGYYLAEQRKLSICRKGKKVSLRTIQKICKKEYAEFEEKFLVYKKLREANYVVSPGIKFGCDFGVYEHGPGIDHSPYLVQVVKPLDEITATEIILSGRLATTVRKQFILAIAEVNKEKVNFISFEWWRA